MGDLPCSVAMAPTVRPSKRLFCGKATLEDIGVFAQLADEGVLAPPRYVPPPFADLNALTAWMCYSNFLNRLDLNRAEADFASLL